MITRQMLSTVSSGNRPWWREAITRIMSASRPGRNAEPPPCRAFTAISLSMISPRCISSPCISLSIRSISERRSDRLSRLLVSLM